MATSSYRPGSFMDDLLKNFPDTKVIDLRDYEIKPSEKVDTENHKKVIGKRNEKR